MLKEVIKKVSKLSAYQNEWQETVLFILLRPRRIDLWIKFRYLSVSSLPLKIQCDTI